MIKKDWYKSTASTNDGTHCVETRIHDDGSVDVRNSRFPDGPLVSFTREEWAAFLVGARRGEFDDR